MWGKKVDPAKVMVSAGGNVLAELLVTILVSLTGNRLLTAKSRRLRRLQERVLSAFVEFGRHLDPEGDIRRARDLAIAEKNRSHGSAAKLLASLPMLPGWLLVAGAVVIAGLETVFIATFFYDNVKQGTTWWSIEGAVSLLVAAVHPLVVTVLTVLAVRFMTRGGRRWLSGVLLVVLLPLDALAVWVLTSYIVDSALSVALAAGLPVAGFPSWVFAMLFTILPVLLVGAILASSDPKVAQVQATVREGNKAARARARRDRLIERRYRRLSRAWLALFQYVVNMCRAVANIRSTGEYGIAEARAGQPGDQTGPAAGAQPSTPVQAAPVPRAAVETAGAGGPGGSRQADLVLQVLTHLQQMRHLQLTPGEQVLVDDLIHAAELLYANPLPSPAQVRKRVLDELGGPAAVSDPSGWEPFQPDDLQTAHQATPDGEVFMPDGVRTTTSHPDASGAPEPAGDPGVVVLPDQQGQPSQPTGQWPVPERTSPNGDRP